MNRVQRGRASRHERAKAKHVAHREDAPETNAPRTEQFFADLRAPSGRRVPGLGRAMRRPGHAGCCREQTRLSKDTARTQTDGSSPRHRTDAANTPFHDRNPFRMRRYPPSAGACKSCGICRYKIIWREVLWILLYQKSRGGGGGSAASTTQEAQSMPRALGGLAAVKQLCELLL